MDKLDLEVKSNDYAIVKEHLFIDGRQFSFIDTPERDIYELNEFKNGHYWSIVQRLLTPKLYNAIRDFIEEMRLRYEL